MKEFKIKYGNQNDEEDDDDDEEDNQDDPNKSEMRDEGNS